jgi:hypothetical protein
MPQTKVVALERGHDGINVRDAGEVFMLDTADVRYKGATWFAPVDAPAAKKAAVKAVRAPGERPPGAGPIPGSRESEARSLESEDML